MVIKNVNLETVCGITSVLPKNTKPEIAFAGKSNVGKSSLINALMNRKSYARISATPGKTQTINYYNINDEMYLVDLPGYGYAKVSEQEKIKWGQLIERYLHSSAQLKAVFLLSSRKKSCTAWLSAMKTAVSIRTVRWLPRSSVLSVKMTTAWKAWK